MKTSPQTTGTEFTGPATYLIVVEGDLDRSYSDRLAGMTISPTDGGDRKPLTTLTGKVLDQAALSGVLETLYSLHLSIVLVQQINRDS